MDEIKLLKEMIDSCNNIVFFGGAGVSTESNIPDFRSSQGIYNQKYAYPPEVILSHEFFMNYTSEFYDFYKNKMIYLNAKPNFAHIALAKLEQEGKLKGIVTQNIDGLHQLAGNKLVYELHGSIMRNYCMRCGKSYDVDYIVNSDDIPKCSCGGVIKPDVVLYNESLPSDAVQTSIKLIEKADLLIVAGTSLSVYPAAGLINYFKGKNLVLINKDKTPYDNKANLVINKNVGEVLKQAVL